MTKLSKPVATIETLKRLVTNSDNKYATKDSLSTVATTGNYSDLKGIPTSLKNPNAISFTDGSTASYDGSKSVTVAIPTSLPANGGNASTVNGYTVLSNVPANAKFTDTVYTHPATHPASMITGLSTVATSGSYDDLSNKPTIPAAYSLPDATTSVKGGVKVGSNLSISSGVLSLTKANVTGALGYTPPTNDTHYTTGLKVGETANATSNAAATNGNVYLNVLDNYTVRDSHKIVGAGATTVTSDANGAITISSTDTNTVYTHPNSGVTAGTYKSVTVNAQGHVTSGTNPTTLSGYGITDAKIANGVITLGANSITPLTSHQSLSNYYTKDEVNSQISSIPKFAISVVTDLPTSNISSTTIYLKKTGDDTQNLYTEYIYVNSKWEQLGTQKLDLSGYLTKTDASNTYLGKYAAAVSANKSTYLLIEKYTGNYESFIPIADSRDGMVSMTPSSTRAVYSPNFTYDTGTDTLKVGNVNSANVVKSINSNNNTITITKGDGSTSNLSINTYTKSESDSKYLPLQINNRTTVTNNSTLVFRQVDTIETIELLRYVSSSEYYEGYLNPTGAYFVSILSGKRNSYGVHSSGISYSNGPDTYWITVNSKSDTIQILKNASSGDNTIKTVATVEDLSKVATSGNYNDLINKPIVDDALSSTSTNAIQNKVVKAELDKKANIASPTFTGTATANNLTVTGSLNIPGGKIWIE